MNTFSPTDWFEQQGLMTRRVISGAIGAGIVSFGLVVGSSLRILPERIQTAHVALALVGSGVLGAVFAPVGERRKSKIEALFETVEDSTLPILELVQADLNKLRGYEEVGTLMGTAYEQQQPQALPMPTQPQMLPVQPQSEPDPWVDNKPEEQPKKTVAELDFTKWSD